MAFDLHCHLIQERKHRGNGWRTAFFLIACSLYFQGRSGSSHLKPTVIFQIPSLWLAPEGKYAAVFFWTRHTNQMIWLWRVEWKCFSDHLGNFPSIDWEAKTAIVISTQVVQAHIGIEVFIFILKQLPNYLLSGVTGWSTGFSGFGVVYYENAKSEEGG